MQLDLQRPRTAATMLLAMLATLALSATGALAQEGYPPGETFTVSCAPGAPAPGDEVDCGATSAEPGEQLEWVAEYNPVIDSGTVTANEDGEASFSFVVPDEVDEDDEITVTVTRADGTVTAAEELPVEEAAEGDEITPVESGTDSTDDELPVTGSQLLLLSLVGVGLVGGGALAVRKRSAA